MHDMMKVCSMMSWCALVGETAVDVLLSNTLVTYLFRLCRVLLIRPSDCKTLGSGTRGEWEISGREERIVE